MIKLRFLILYSCIAVLIALPTHAQSLMSGRDRFSDNPAMSTDELVDRLKTNGTFRKNLARHFDLPEERVVAFVQEALVPYTLPTAVTVMNYGVTKGGKIYGKKTLLKKGTPVWATRSARHCAGAGSRESRCARPPCAQGNRGGPASV